MALIAYIDETGDHSLEPMDKSFPIFVLVFFICDTSVYLGEVVPAVYRLKIEYFGHEGVILHSRDIRKWHGEFAFLSDPTKRETFHEGIKSNY